jgi:hypothetical protein
MLGILKPARVLAESETHVIATLCPRHRRALSGLLLLCVLFAQGALAALPCLSPQATAADAFETMPAGCNEAPPSNLCLAHCIAADQTSGHPDVVLAAPCALAFGAPAAVIAGPARRPALPSARARAQGPPVLLRLCSLLL